MTIRLNSTRAGRRRKQPPIALDEPACKVVWTEAPSTRDDVEGVAPSSPSRDSASGNPVRVHHDRHDPHDLGQYASEWDPRLE
jgi:hypothetical protein